MSVGAAVVAVVGEGVLVMAVVPVYCMIVTGLRPAKAAELWRMPLMWMEPGQSSRYGRYLLEFCW